MIGALVILAFVLLALMSLPWFTSRDTSTETFADADVTRAEIEVNGAVDVRTGEVAEVTFLTEWRWTGRPTTEARVEDGVLTVRGDCSGVAFISRCGTAVDVVVPAGAQVVVQASAGGVHVDGVQGGVDLRSTAGGIEVRDVVGPAVLRSSAGGISGTVAGGDVDAESSAGGVELTVTGSFDRLSASSSAGGIDLTVPDEAYRVDADTSAGSVDVQVRTDPEGASEIFARSSAGSVTIRNGSGG